MKRKFFVSLLTLILICTSFIPFDFLAAETQDNILETDNILLNSLYDDIRTESQTQKLIQSLNELKDSSNASISTFAVSRANAAYTTTADAADYIADQMVARESTITVPIQTSVLPDNIWELLYEAMEYSDKCTGQEGDALSTNYTGASANYYTSNGVAYITYYVSYRTTTEQEAELTSAVDTALASMDLTSKTDYQKVRVIYDYICEHVDYDYEHLEAQEAGEGDYPLMYTAYAAMCDGKAVCQGYATLFYRMCKDAGLSVRYVNGYGNTGAHAWNIVKIGDEYYNLDSTWDGQDEESYHNYFLKSQVDFTDHTRSSSFDTEEFHAKFPMASDSWEDYANLSATGGLDYDNLSEAYYFNIDGGEVSNQASGKPKILVFGNVGCYYTRNTIKSLSQESFEDIDVIYVDAQTNTQSAVIDFRSTYGSSDDDIIYTYNPSGTNMWNYVRYLSGASRITYPFIVYIDADNKVQYYENGGVFSANIVRQHAMVYIAGEELVSISDETIKLTAGNSYKLDIYVYGMTRNAQFFTWSSSDTSVATVDENGKVTAKSEGITTITCKINDNMSVNCQVNITYTGLKKSSDGSWCYYKDSVVDTEYTGVVQYGKEWWYVKNGKVDFTYDGIASNAYGTWYIENGKVDFCINGVCMRGNNWYLFKNGKVNSITSVEQNAYGWWYVKNGKVDFTYDGIASNAYGTWYIENGKVDFSINGVCIRGNNWYLFKNGKVNSITSVEQNAYGWWYVKNGKVDFTYDGVASNTNGTWYIENGKVDFSINGVCMRGNNWYLFKNGKVNSITSVEQNAYGWWYVKNGKVDFTYDGVASNANGTWYIENGKVDFSINGVCMRGNNWYLFKNGKVDFSYNGMASNANGTWYIKNGKVDFTYTGKISIDGIIYNIEKGKVIS